MAKTKILPRGSDLYARLIGLEDVDAPGVYPTTATVVCNILTKAGVAVSNGSGIPMPYLSPTTGAETQYRGVVPYNVALVKNTEYDYEIIATFVGGSVHRETGSFQAGPV